MQLSIATILLAATSAIAAPSVGKRESNFIIKDLKARTSLSNTMSFTLLDNANPEGDAAMKCNLIW